MNGCAENGGPENAGTIIPECQKVENAACRTGKCRTTAVEG